MVKKLLAFAVIVAIILGAAYHRRNTRSNLFIRAESAFLNKDFKEAALLYKKIIKQKKKPGIAMKRLGDIYFLRYEKEKKVTHARRCFELYRQVMKESSGQSFTLFRRLGILANVLDFPRESTAYLIKYLEVDKHMPNSVAQFLDTGFDRKQLPSPSKLSLKENALLLLVDNCLKLQNVAAAKRYFSIFTSDLKGESMKGDKLRRVLMQKAHLHYFSNEKISYVSTLKRVNEEFPTYMPAHFQLGQYWAQNGESKRAVSYLENAYHLNKLNPDVNHLLARCYYQDLQYAKADKLLSELDSSGTITPQGLFLKGVLAERRKELSLARNYYQRAKDGSSAEKDEGFFDTLTQRISRIDTMTPRLK